MPAIFTIPRNSSYTILEAIETFNNDLTNEYILVFNSNEFTGGGTLGNQSVLFSFFGSDLDNQQLAGVIDTYTFSIGGQQVVEMNGLNITLYALTLASVYASDGTDPAAVEKLFLDRDWEFHLTDQNDIATQGMAFGPGNTFNPIGDDIFWGYGGNDNLFGGDGDDTMHGGNGADILSGGDGEDELNGDDGDDTLNGGDGADELSGSDGKDELNGDDGNDELDGGDGKDKLNGGGGNDTLIGGGDND
uniref:calcium-binding protein n=1 Tax=Falsiphaeobacter marinintestinus TaxID=1492905 RepID=UPI003CCC859C